MIKLNITIEENDEGMALKIESEKAGDSTFREFSCAKAFAEIISGTSKTVTRFSESAEIERRSNALLKSFEGATKKMFGRDIDDMIKDADKARKSGESIDSFLKRIAEEHAAKDKPAEDSAPDEQEKPAAPTPEAAAETTAG